MVAARLLLRASTRRGVLAVGAATCSLYAQQQWSRADDADDETEPPKKEPPKPPSIYKEGGFDPSAIEEVAEIVRSGMSKSDMQHDIAKQKELQQEEKRKAKEYRAQARQIAQGGRQAQRQEEETTRRMQAEELRKREAYKQQLKAETEQAATKLEEAMKDSQAELRKAHEARLEAIRRETMELEMQLKREVEIGYVKARAAADARGERETFDLRMAQMAERAGLRRDAVLEAVQQTFSSLGGGVTALLGDTNRMLSLAAVVTGVAAGFYGARKAAHVLGDFVEARLRKPSLVRETSRGFAVASAAVGSNALGRTISRAQRLADVLTGKKQLDEARLMAGAGFEPALENQLVRIAREAAGMRAADSPFRHCLFHGPPGTGKTLFAKKLAAHARMDYAIMSGGDVAPLGREAVTDMHKLFDWADTSPRGLLLLIDEADAFARRRHRDMSEDARNALNAFLYRTGTPSTDVLVVFATNAPQLFDKAIHDRVDEIVLFDVPGPAERLAILREACAAMQDPQPDPDRRKWWDFGAGPVAPAVVFGEGVDDAAIARAADATEGFSARELSKLAIAWQAQAYSTPDRVLTLADFEEVIGITHAQNKLKKEWHEMALERKRKREERLAALNRRDPLAMKTALAAAARAAEEVEARFLVPNLALRTAEGVVRSSDGVLV
mmetsp:Transcript_4880/g.14446  ORF Transcript_4880/g.14446 Transcript_4880/m.14446 type:complete len:671 (-) Transcript_4880:31-2043(-)